MQFAISVGNITMVAGVAMARRKDAPKPEGLGKFVGPAIDQRWNGSDAELSRILGFRPEVISRCRTNKDVDEKHIEAILTFLGVDIRKTVQLDEVIFDPNGTIEDQLVERLRQSIRQGKLEAAQNLVSFLEFGRQPEPE